MQGLFFPQNPILSKKGKNPQKNKKMPTKIFFKKAAKGSFHWCLLFKFFKLRKAGDIFIRFCAKINEWQ